MSNEEAIEEFNFFNEGDYITREMSKAKDIVLKKLQETESDLYEANKRIADLLLILGDRDRIIDLMAEDIIKYETELGYEGNYKNEEEVIKYFKERCHNG